MRALLLSLLVVAAPSAACADAIDGPPACPPGSQGRSSHAGQWCVPSPCSTDADCPGGACRPWRVCTRASMVPPGGHGGMDRPPTRQILVVATCDPSAACTGTEEPPPQIAGTLEPGPPTCTDAPACVPAALPALPPRGTSAPSPDPATAPTQAPPAAPASGCTCGARTTRASLAPIALSIAAIALASRRRRP